MLFIFGTFILRKYRLPLGRNQMLMSVFFLSLLYIIFPHTTYEVAFLALQPPGIFTKNPSPNLNEFHSFLNNCMFHCHITYDPGKYHFCSSNFYSFQKHCS